MRQQLGSHLQCKELWEHSICSWMLSWKAKLWDLQSLSLCLIFKYDIYISVPSVFQFAPELTLIQVWLQNSEGKFLCRLSIGLFVQIASGVKFHSFLRKLSAGCWMCWGHSAVMNLVLEMQNVRTVAAPITAVCGSCEVLSKPKVVLMTMWLVIPLESLKKYQGILEFFWGGCSVNHLFWRPGLDHVTVNIFWWCINGGWSCLQLLREKLLGGKSLFCNGEMMGPIA
jgi:hypothetical protein